MTRLQYNAFILIGLDIALILASGVGALLFTGLAATICGFVSLATIGLLTTSLMMAHHAGILDKILR